MRRLDDYFATCIKDAYKDEGRKYNASEVVCFYVVVGDQLLFEVETPYERVTRKVVYRVRNNMQKNFGFTTQGNFCLASHIDVNHVCNKLVVRCGNKDHVYHLLDMDNKFIKRKGKFSPCYRYEELCRVYHDIPKDMHSERNFEHLPLNITWDTYRRVFFEAFNVAPEVEIDHKSKNVKVVYE